MKALYFSTSGSFISRRKNINPLKTVLIIFLLSFYFCLPTHAEAVEIFASPAGGGDGTSYSTPTTLQNALDTRNSGDSINIYLLPGTYDASTNTLSLQLATNEIEVVSIFGAVQEDGSFVHDNSLTVLDGGGTNQILRLNTHANGASLYIRIIGMTFQNALTSDDGNPKTINHGGAISAYQGNVDSSSTIVMKVEHCEFHNNKTAGSLSGGAIYSNCLVRLAECDFSDNEAYNGGAIIAYALPGGDQTATLEIEKCDFSENKNFGNQGSSIWHNLTLQMSKCFFEGMQDGSDVGNGSCIWGNEGSTSHISQCVFTDIIIKYWGSAIQSFGGSAYIDNCIFKNNKAGGVDGLTDGYGAIAFYYSNQPATTKRITNCTFVGNRSRYPASSPGGAIHNRGLSNDDFKVHNCIFWDNGSMPVVTQMGVASISHSDIQSGALTGFQDGGGNINLDPLFADTLFHLQYGSPCINTGTNTFEPLPDEDFDGNTRILSETIDMGAYECNSAPDSIGLSDTLFSENLASGSVVATITGRDPDTEDIPELRYELVPGDGSNDADNDLFEIDGQDLKLMGTVDYETDSMLYIHLGITDPGDSTYNKPFVLKLLNANDPVVVSGNVTAEQSVLAGEEYNYTYPEDLFYDQDGMETVTVTASLDDDSALPAWLGFDVVSRTFSGTPLNGDVDSLNIKITAADTAGSSASVNFGLKIEFNTGMDGFEKQGLLIYPNPASDYAMLSFDPSQGELGIRVFNLAGKCILKVNHIRSSPYRLDLRRLEPGVYLIKATGRELYHLKLVKQGK